MYQALRLIRIFNDMSATELAVKLKISKSYLSEIERGKKRVDMELVKAYGKVFGIRPSTIVLLGESIESEKGDAKHWMVSRLGRLLQEVEVEGTRALQPNAKSPV